MVVCTPCLLPVVKAGAVGLTGVFAYSKVGDKNTKRKKKKNTRRKKKTVRRKKTKKARSQSGGSGMTDTAGDYERWLSDLSRQDSDEYNELQKIHAKQSSQTYHL